MAETIFNSDTSQRRIVFYSGMYLTAISLLDLTPESSRSDPIYLKIRSHVVTKPTTEIPPLTLGECYQFFREVLAQADAQPDHVPPYVVKSATEGTPAKGSWVGVTPAHRVWVRLLETWCEQGLSVWDPVFIRNYTDERGGSGKITWAGGLGSKYVVDLGGAGSLKLLDGTTTQPIGTEVESGTYQIDDDGSSLRGGILELLSKNQVDASEVTVGMTGNWRVRDNSEQVVSTLVGAGLSRAVVVGDTDELTWEHEAACRALASTIPSTRGLSGDVITIGSGSNSSQLGIRRASGQVTCVPIPFGINIKAPTTTTPSSTWLDTALVAGDHLVSHFVGTSHFD